MKLNKNLADIVLTFIKYLFDDKWWLEEYYTAQGHVEEVKQNHNMKNISFTIWFHHVPHKFHAVGDIFNSDGAVQFLISIPPCPKKSSNILNPNEHTRANYIYNSYILIAANMFGLYQDTLNSLDRFKYMFQESVLKHVFCIVCLSIGSYIG